MILKHVGDGFDDSVRPVDIGLVVVPHTPSRLTVDHYPLTRVIEAKGDRVSQYNNRGSVLLRVPILTARDAVQIKDYF